MKKLLFLCALALAATGCSQSKSDLYEITDDFVESLNTTYVRYGITDFESNMRVTPDGYYQVFPVGRLINVKILEVVEDEAYEDLKEECFADEEEGEEGQDDAVADKMPS